MKLDGKQVLLDTNILVYWLRGKVVPLPWTEELVTSLLRSEPQLRLSRSGHVGLASRDDVRAPTRGELIRQQVEKAGGRLDLGAVEATLRETYGRVPPRAELSAECRRHELQLDANAVTSREGSTDAPSIDVNLAGRVAGVPAAARQHFDELLQAPAEPAVALLERARAHLGDIEAAGHHNEFIDSSTSRRAMPKITLRSPDSRPCWMRS